MDFNIKEIKGTVNNFLEVFKVLFKVAKWVIRWNKRMDLITYSLSCGAVLAFICLKALTDVPRLGMYPKHIDIDFDHLPSSPSSFLKKGF